MKLGAKIVSFLFHPLFLPLVASYLYFEISPRFFPEPIIKAKLLAISIITIFIPMVFFFLLKTLGLANSIFLPKTKERILPLAFFIALIFALVIRYVFDESNFLELHYFFVGIIFSSLTAFFMALFKLKVSLHLTGISGVLMFVIALSIHFKINLLFMIAVLVSITGLIATARLQAKAHTGIELLLGFFTGFIPQLLVLKYWL